MLNLQIQNFRGLRVIDWNIPKGVSALVGPNGSGKSTLLGAVEIVKLALTRGIVRALELRGGLWGLRTIGTADEESVHIALADPQREQRYVMQFVIGRSVQVDESVDHPLFRLERSPKSAAVGISKTDQKIMIRRDDKRLLLRVAGEHLDESAKFELLSAVEAFRLYDRYHLDTLRKGSEQSSDQSLTKDGRNVFAVLKNWLGGTREHRARYQFVCDALQDAFPDLFTDFEFAAAGQIVTAGIVRPRSEYSIPCYFAPIGFWVAMLHLAAVVSSPDDGLVAFDGFENELHPFAVRSLIASIREWAEPHALSVVLATHSPVVLDQFKGDDADRIFVMEPSEKVLPVPLSKLCNREWLAQFAYGDLYAHEQYGAPGAK